MIKDTVQCPNCKGWGTEKLPITKGFKTCPECLGYGTQMATDYYTLYFGMPSFVNFGRRRLMSAVRATAVILFISLILSLIYFIFLLGRGVFV